MRCEKCDTEMRIKNSAYKTIDGKFYMVQKITCENANCTEKGKIIEIKHELQTE